MGRHVKKRRTQLHNQMFDMLRKHLQSGKYLAILRLAAHLVKFSLRPTPLCQRQEPTEKTMRRRHTDNQASKYNLWGQDMTKRNGKEMG